MEDIASLAIKVDSTQVKDASNNLDKLGKSAKETDNSVSNSGASWQKFAGILTPLNITIATVAASIIGLGKTSIMAAEDARISVAKMELIYRNSGKNIKVTLSQIEEQVQSLAKTTIFDDDSLRDAAREFVKFGNISGDTLRSLIKTTTDYARVTDQDVVSAAHSMARALADTDSAARLLKEAGIALTRTEQDYIKALVESNREAEAQALIADKLQSAYSGAAEQLVGLESNILGVKNAWGEFTEAVGNSVIGQFISDSALVGLDYARRALVGITNLINGVKQGSEASDSWGRGASDSWEPNKTEAQMQKEIALVKAQSKSGVGGGRAKRSAGLSEEAKEAKKLADEYENLTNQLAKEIELANFGSKEQEKAALTYDLMYGKLKNLTMSQKEFLANQLAQRDANQSLTDSNEEHKNQLASLVDEYNKLTLSAREYYQLQLTTKGIAPNQQGDLLAQFDKNIKAESDKKAIDDANQSLKSYIEGIDKANNSMQGLGSVTNSVFDSALGGISQLAGALANMTQQLLDNSNALAENKKQLTTAQKDPVKNANTILTLLSQEKKIIGDKDNIQLSGIRQVAGATSAMFENNTKARKAFHAVEIALGAIELSKTIAGLAAKGVSAILSQGSVPIVGFGLMAAMTAIVGALIASVGGAFSGSKATAPPTATGTGTVLGDSSAKSESIDKTYNLLKDIHAEEYTELRGINKGIQTLRDAITGTVTRAFQGGGINAANVSGLGTSNNFGPNGGLLGGIYGFFFGSVKKSIEAFGLKINSTKIEDILKGLDINAEKFTTIKTVSKGFLGGLFGGGSTSFSDVTEPLDKGLKGSITLIFRSMTGVMLDVAKSFGGGLKNDIRKYVIPDLKIDLKGLKGEEALAKLNNVISATLDNMASSVFGKIIGQYQQLGEGMLETAIRIVSEMAVVRDALGKSGISVKNNIIAIADKLVQSAGGLQQFQEQFSVYFDKFYSDNEKLTFLRRSLVSQLRDVGLTLPKNEQAYRKLLEAQNVEYKAGQQRYSLLLKLSGQAAKYYEALSKSDPLSLQNRKETLSSAISNINAIINSLTGGIKNATEILTPLRAQRAGAKNDLLSQLGLLNSGNGNKLNAELIGNAVGILNKPAESLFSNMLDFKREQGRTLALLSTFSDRAIAQKNVWQLQLDALNGIAVNIAAMRAAQAEIQKTSKKTSDLLTAVTRDGQSLVTVAA
jgi:hypothetical protein